MSGQAFGGLMMLVGVLGAWIILATWPPPEDNDNDEE
jgi:hypothetical protein